MVSARVCFHSSTETMTMAKKRKTDQQQRLPVRRRIRKQAEGRAGIFRVREPEKSRNDLDVGINCDASRDQPLRPLVEHHDDQGQ